MANSVTEICNLALQKLGAKRISAITEDSANGRACNACYELMRDAELEDHPWKFAIGRASLVSEATGPSWGKAYQYQLPSDFICLLPDYEEDNTLYKDWVIEGKFILTDDTSPIYVRYIKKVTDVSQYSPLFADALACRMALQMCETLTQSNTKKADAAAEYKAIIARAKKRNGIQQRAQVSPDAEWISARS